MTPQEKEQLFSALGRGADALTQAVRGFSEADALVRPAPDRWPTLECVEHLVWAEEYLLSTILAGQSEGSTKIGREREQLISAMGLDRTRRISAPEMARPRGRFTTLAAGMEGFQEARKTTLRFVQDCQDDLRSKFTTHPLVGNVNCWEILLMIMVHPSRHAEQINEIARSSHRRLISGAVSGLRRASRRADFPLD